MIKTLHMVWVGPHDPPSELIKTWDDKHSNGWLFTLWRDHTGWKNQDQINIMSKKMNPEWNGVADIVRWEILLKYGGFVVDADSECLRALDSPPEDFVSEIESGKALFSYENEAVRPGIVGCGFIAGPKGHPFFQRCVDECATADMQKPAWTTVGPMLATRIANEMPEAVHVYPAKYFNPLHYSGTQAPGVTEGFEPYARQAWGSTKGCYNNLRKRVCWCSVCRVNSMRNPWSGTGFQ